MSSLELRVALLSGEEATVVLPRISSVDTLRKRAQDMLNNSIGKLITTAGVLLQGSASLESAGLSDGDVVTALVQEGALVATEAAFAFIRPDGSVVTWGDPDSGGDSRAVQEDLRDVVQIKAAGAAFAAIRRDGSVVTWGCRGLGGDSSRVRSQLRHVNQIQANMDAFAAITEDGRVVAWGDPEAGGDCSLVSDQLHDVKQIQSTMRAFAALRADGRVVTWGDEECGGDCTDVRHELENVRKIAGGQGNFAFAAITALGRIVVWDGLDSAVHETGLDNIEYFYLSDPYRWVAATEDGCLALRLTSRQGNAVLKVPDFGTKMQSLDKASVALIQRDGTVEFWGCAVPQPLRDELRDVLHIQRTDRAFAAIRSDDSVVTWGNPRDGGDSCAVQQQLTNIKAIQSNRCAFAAIREDGTVVTWGDT